jgi:hypothetical protein
LPLLSTCRTPAPATIARLHVRSAHDGGNGGICLHRILGNPQRRQAAALMSRYYLSRLVVVAGSQLVACSP